VALRFPRKFAAAACLGLSALAVNCPVQAGTPIQAVADNNPDQKLAEAIAVKLGATSHLNGYQLDLTCEGGIVELNGTVKDNAQRAELMKVVRGVRGVKNVVDSMTIKSDVQKVQAIDPPAGGNVPPVPPSAGTGMPGTPYAPQSTQPPPLGMQQGAPQNLPQGLQTMPQGISGDGYHGPIQDGPPNMGGYQGGPPMGGYQGGQLPPPGAMDGGYGGGGNDPAPIGMPPTAGLYDAAPPKMPPYAWPTYAPYNNYSRCAYPQMYPANAFPFIGPYYPFPKVPPGYRSIKLEWEDGAWYYGRTATKRDWWRIRYW